MRRKRSDGLSMEEAIAEAEASLRLEGMYPSGPVYTAVKARLIAGEIDFDQAVAELLKPRPAQILHSPNGLPMFPPTGKALTLEMVKAAEEEMNLEDAQRADLIRDPE